MDFRNRIDPEQAQRWLAWVPGHQTVVVTTNPEDAAILGAAHIGQRTGGTVRPRDIRVRTASPQEADRWAASMEHATAGVDPAGHIHATRGRHPAARRLPV